MKNSISFRHISPRRKATELLPSAAILPNAKIIFLFTLPHTRPYIVEPSNPILRHFQPLAVLLCHVPTGQEECPAIALPASVPVFILFLQYFTFLSLTHYRRTAMINAVIGNSSPASGQAILNYLVIKKLSGNYLKSNG